MRGLYALVWLGVIVVASATDVSVGNDATVKDHEPECPKGQRILSDKKRPWEGAKPPQTMPEAMTWAYTRCGTIDVYDYYVDDTNKGQRTHFKFHEEEIGQWVSRWTRYTEVSDNEMVKLRKDMWVVQALRRHDIRGQNVIVYGSIDPKIESLALAFGAAHVTTVEHNTLTFNDSRMTTATVDEFEGLRGDTQYDVAFSVSSFDHDGLGRYGDPLAPDGDLMAMDVVKSHLKPGGKLFLTVPVGKDAVAWNLHRRYGSIRLPLLLDGWTIVDHQGWRGDLLDHDGYIFQSYEPVFVLQPNPKQHADITTVTSFVV